MSRAASLLNLQSIDLELDTIKARLQAIEAALGDHPSLRQAQQDQLAAQGQLHTARVAIQNLEYENQALNEKLHEVSGRMYGGHVSNPKELQDLQKEIDSLGRRRSALEEQQFEALLAAELAEAQHQLAAHNVELLEAEAAKSHGDLLDERARLRSSIDRLNVGREAMLSSVLPADAGLYLRLRVSKKGRPVTRIEDGSCSSCGVAPSSSRIQSARQDSELVLCGNCGRILCAD